MSEAYGRTWAEGVSAGRLAADACGDGDQDAGQIRQGTGTGVHRDLCRGVLETGIPEMGAMEKYSGERG